ncbi:hypothetical protein GN958_ATG14821, partial [Phytophthora infestans]
DAKEQTAIVVRFGKIVIDVHCEAQRSTATCTKLRADTDCQCWPANSDRAVEFYEAADDITRGTSTCCFLEFTIMTGAVADRDCALFLGLCWHVLGGDEARSFVAGQTLLAASYYRYSTSTAPESVSMLTRFAHLASRLGGAAGSSALYFSLA